jgi:hypothetical protein
MNELTFQIDIDETNHSSLQQYSREELNGFAKFAFEKWYAEQFQGTFTTDNIQTQIDQGLEPTINRLFGISKSTAKGKVFEYVLEETISTQFRDCKYVDTASTSHVGDGLLTLSNGAECIVEAKNYTTVVPTAQIEKLKSDMRSTGITKAILLATGTITGKPFFDIETFGSNHIVYVSNYFDNPQLHLQLAITVIKHMTHVEVASWDVLQRMNTLNRTINSVTKLKTDYIAMEKSIRMGLDSFYMTLREYESDVKIQINNIIDSTPSLNEDLIGRHNNPLLDRLYHEIIVPLGLTLSGTTDVEILANGVEVVKIKILKNSLNISFVNPVSKFNITNDNFVITVKMLKSMLEPYQQITSEEKAN